MHCPSRSFVHVISANAVDLEAQMISAACRRGGYDPARLDFSVQAAQRLVDEALESSAGLGIEVSQCHWVRTWNGGVEMAVETARADDLVGLKLALS